MFEAEQLKTIILDMSLKISVHLKYVSLNFASLEAILNRFGEKMSKKIFLCSKSKDIPLLFFYRRYSLPIFFFYLSYMKTFLMTPDANKD